MLWTIIIIIFVLWLLGAFGGRVFNGFPKTGNWVHILIVIALILLILKLLNVIQLVFGSAFGTIPGRLRHPVYHAGCFSRVQPNEPQFINADDTSILQATQGELLGANLFAYCRNNPVMNSDPSGYWVVAAIISGILNVAVNYIAQYASYYVKFHTGPCWKKRTSE